MQREGVARLIWSAEASQAAVLRATSVVLRPCGAEVFCGI